MQPRGKSRSKSNMTELAKDAAAPGTDTRSWRRQNDQTPAPASRNWPGVEVVQTKRKAKPTACQSDRLCLLNKGGGKEPHGGVGVDCNHSTKRNCDANQQKMSKPREPPQSEIRPAVISDAAGNRPKGKADAQKLPASTRPVCGHTSRGASVLLQDRHCCPS